MRAKRNIIFSICILFWILSSCKQENDSITAITYNIRYDSPNDGDNIWKNRKQGLVKLLKNHHPDIIGTQEGLSHQLDYIKSELRGYKMIGIDRDNNGKGEYSSIFYNSNTIDLIDTNTFWLSETPEIPSKGWDAAYNRVCTYGQFKSRVSGKKFFVFNTHFDHLGKLARLNSATLINQKIKEINIDHLPIILMGDLNCEPKSKPIKELKRSLADGLLASSTKLQGPAGTYSGFDVNTLLNRRIDYVFANEFDIIKYSHIDSKISNGNWPSDHLPVLVKVAFK